MSGVYDEIGQFRDFKLSGFVVFDRVVKLRFYLKCEHFRRQWAFYIVSIVQFLQLRALRFMSQLGNTRERNETTTKASTPTEERLIKTNNGSATEQDLKRTKYLATELRYWLATEQNLTTTT